MKLQILIDGKWVTVESSYVIYENIKNGVIRVVMVGKEERGNYRVVDENDKPIKAQVVFVEHKS